MLVTERSDGGRWQPDAGMREPPICSQAMRVGVMLVAAQNWHSCARGCFWLADRIDGSLT